MVFVQGGYRPPNHIERKIEYTRSIKKSLKSVNLDLWWAHRSINCQTAIIKLISWRIYLRNLYGEVSVKAIVDC